MAIYLAHQGLQQMMQLETIMIVDPDAHTRALMQQPISNAGFDVIQAASGQQGLDLCDDQTPALVLMNTHLADMDGITFCRNLRALPAANDVPIVIMAEEDDVDIIRQAYDSGATDFIIKPVNWLLFIHRLQFILRASTAMRSARTNERLLAEAQRIARMGNWTWDLSGEEMHVSDEICRIFGVPMASPCVFHQLFINAIHEDDKKALDRALERASTGDTADVELRIRRPDGMQRTLMVHAESNSQARKNNLLGTMQDITDRKKADEAIRKLAFYDQVTGLPNRTLFREHLSMAMHHARRNGTKIAVLFLDLDNFKRINDSLGHVAGDQLLQEVSSRLQLSIRSTDLAATDASSPERKNASKHSLARLGGDEFTIMLVDIKNEKQINIVSDRILESLNEPFMLAGNRVVVTSSIGIAIYPEDGDEIDTLLKHADAAMYQVKSNGRNGVFFYDDQLRRQSKNRLQLESELYHALEHDEMALFYQPKVAVNSLQVAGFEALIRWIHPERGMIPPLDFISVAEDSGLIIPMGKWVIRTACRQHQTWLEAGFGPINISVNLSCHQFADRQLLHAVRETLEETGMQPKHLEFEITESVLMQDADTAMLVLGEMKKMGMKISIDDFGTGYSSMAYLKHFPIDVLKVDRSFVMNLPDDEQEATITTAIVKLAHALALGVVAEGVENAEQLQFLSDLDCDQIQGYLFSPPVPAEQAEMFLNAPFTVGKS
jgi:PAS domain S-box-containing protein